ncbi:MAG TPA: futalosine hydrolase [Vicinamibacterales bacterium]|nr:futalosine hydrolase [Vicinamibacterales bacterium]
MRTLIVVATPEEIAPIEPMLRARADTEVLVTGVGMVATAARCSRRLAQNRCDFALNLGLCGSFDPLLTPGVVVHVVSDRLSELGAEDGDAFVAIESLRLPSDHVVENLDPPHNAALAWLPKVSGITVNTVHGHPAAIAAVVARCRPQVESMEGAAFMYSCRLAGVKYAQVRAISNVVERRNRAAWKVPEAVDALAAAARGILQLA